MLGFSSEAEHGGPAELTSFLVSGLHIWLAELGGREPGTEGNTLGFSSVVQEGTQEGS